MVHPYRTSVVFLIAGKDKAIQGPSYKYFRGERKPGLHSDILWLILFCVT